MRKFIKSFLVFFVASLIVYAFAYTVFCFIFWDILEIPLSFIRFILALTIVLNIIQSIDFSTIYNLNQKLNKYVSK